MEKARREMIAIMGRMKTYLQNRNCIQQTLMLLLLSKMGKSLHDPLHAEQHEALAGLQAHAAARRRVAFSGSSFKPIGVSVKIQRMSSGEIPLQQSRITTAVEYHETEKIVKHIAFIALAHHSDVTASGK
jgi:hypothetical protein